MSKKLIPFHLMPGAWGLKGKTRDVAQAEYELEGYELERRLLKIKEDEYSSKEVARRGIDIDYRYHKITQMEQLRLLAELIDDDQQRSLAMLELDLRENKITDLEFQKQSATLRKEPWVTVLNMDFAGAKSLEGSFELDWNSFFVDQLTESGYQGPTPDAIVNSWFMEVCRNVALEEFDGTGDFTADSQANLETMKRWNSAQPINNGKTIYK
jgi:hypothetical protein